MSRFFILLMVAFFSFFSTMTFSVTEYEPSNLSIKIGDVMYNFWGEKYYYYNIYYKNALVFVVKDKYVALFNSYMQEADRLNVNLKCHNVGNGKFNSKWKIHQNFFVQKDHSAEYIFAAIDEIKLNYSGSYYYVSLRASKWYRVDYYVYKRLEALLLSAQNKDVHIKVNIDIIVGNSVANYSDIYEEFKIVEQKIASGMRCEICFERNKNTMMEPCNHLCACETCAEAITKKCPICNQAISQKRRVYY